MADLQLVKGEQSIIMRTRDAKIVLTNAVSEFRQVEFTKKVHNLHVSYDRPVEFS